VCLGKKSLILALINMSMVIVFGEL